MADSASSRRAVAVLVAAATLLMAMVVWPLWEPLLVAALLVAVLSPLYERATARWGQRRSLWAVLFSLGTVLLILLPLAGLVLIAVREALQAATVVKQTLASSGLSGLIARAPAPLEGWLRSLQKYAPARIEEARTQLAQGGQWALTTLSGTLA